MARPATTVGPYQTCIDASRIGCRDGTIERVLLALAEHLREAGDWI